MEVSTKDRKVILGKEDFGIFWDYITDDIYTDIDYNGTELWIKNIYGEKVIVERNLPMEFLNKFCQRVADSVNGYFTPQDPVLEAETETLRISIIHEVVAGTGRSICIRKVSEKLRFSSAREVIDAGYCSDKILQFLVNCVLAKCNIMICGEMGVGKTEWARFLSHYIPNEQRVITLEDSPEWHYKNINPDHDCVSLKVNKQVGYSELLKACLRQDAVWIMLSETRGREVVNLIENLMSGARVISTIHSDDVRKIPNRMLSMTGDRNDAERLAYNIYECLDIGILLRWKGKKRYIDQICAYYMKDDKYKIDMIVSNGKLIFEDIPETILTKFKVEEITDPFSCHVIQEELKTYEETARTEC